MDDLLDMIAADESPSQISDKIKELLFTKAAGKVDEFRPTVAVGMFDQDQNQEEQEEE